MYHITPSTGGTLVHELHPVVHLMYEVQEGQGFTVQCIRPTLMASRACASRLYVHLMQQ